MLKSLMFKMFWLWDLPGNPVVQTPLSNVGGGLSPNLETSAWIARKLSALLHWLQ